MQQLGRDYQQKANFLAKVLVTRKLQRRVLHLTFPNTHKDSKFGKATDCFSKTRERKRREDATKHVTNPFPDARRLHTYIRAALLPA